MIERVVLHQSRFRTPGLVPDARGVALGPLGLVLLQSTERLVSFLRAAGEEGALDELLDAMRILQVLSPLRTSTLPAPFNVPKPLIQSTLFFFIRNSTPLACLETILFLRSRTLG